ncbi:amino acid transporter [Bacillus sp. SORGH_AS 510]|nr:amino acid transporter [Bacillus sp. SORGH_AS_0510]
MDNLVLFYAISRDGLLPKVFSKVDKKKQTPTVNSWITCLLVAFFAGFVPLGRLAELVNMGTLFAFMTVSIGILYLRKNNQAPKTGFRVPFVPYIPILAFVFCGYLALQLPAVSWISFGVWLVIGLIVYFVYGHRNSTLNTSSNRLRKVS